MGAEVTEYTCECGNAITVSHQRDSFVVCCGILYMQTAKGRIVGCRGAEAVAGKHECKHCGERWK